MIDINEAIRIAVVFSPRGLRPVWFDWRGRQIWVRDVAFSWRTMQGRANIIHYSVTDGQGLYELSFNQDSMAWKLMHAEWGNGNEER
jgi:hypothetical protein